MYQLAHSRHVCRLEDGKLIPLELASDDLSGYQAWLASGNQPAAPLPKPILQPQSVSRFQAYAALHQAGLLSQIENLMVAPQTNMLARLAWQQAQEFRRDSPTVAGMAALLGLDEATVDGLFIAAAKITA